LSPVCQMSCATIAVSGGNRRYILKVRLYNTQRCPYARRTRIVLYEKGVDFEVREVDLSNKSEEFLGVSPTGKVPVIVVDGDSLYESNIVNQYLDEITGEPGLMSADPKARAQARIWMSSADENFFPAVFVASVGRELGFPEERISDSFEKLEMVLSFLEARLEGRELEERGEVSLDRYPNVAAWMERIEARESFGAAT